MHIDFNRFPLCEYDLYSLDAINTEVASFFFKKHLKQNRKPIMTESVVV